MLEVAEAPEALLDDAVSFDPAEGYELTTVQTFNNVYHRLVQTNPTEGTKLEGAMKELAGVTSIAFTDADPVALAKALAKFAKDNPEITVKAGVLDGRVLNVKEVEALATMPSKEELYSKLLFLINAPAQRLVTVMNAVGRDLAVVIDQGVQKNKFAGGAEAPAAEDPSTSNGSVMGAKTAAVKPAPLDPELAEALNAPPLQPFWSERFESRFRWIRVRTLFPRLGSRRNSLELVRSAWAVSAKFVPSVW